MCDYCGCRSEPPLEQLGREHAEILRHLADVEDAIGARDMARARAGLAHVVAHLLPHMDKEERGLFTQLRTESELVGEVEGLEGEHDDVRTIVNAMPVDDGEWIKSTTALIDTLREHIHVEEYDLFPAAFQMLSNEGWMTVRKVHEDSAPTEHSHSH